MNSETDKLIGSYKISEPMLKRMIAKKIVNINGTLTESASSLELLALIYFTQISSIDGIVKDFKVSDLQPILDCSKRMTYNIIDNLIYKKFITIYGDSWSGIKTIHILDNDFSQITNFKENRYLNTNHAIFLPTDKNTYNEFKKLSLYAKRTLLIVMFNYNYKYGYRASVDTIKDLLGIKERYKVVSYLKELAYILDEKTNESFYSVSKDTRKRLKHGNINITASNHNFVFESGIGDEQDSYFKRSWELLLKNQNIIDDDLYKTEKKAEINTYLGILYSGMQQYVKENSYEQCKQIAVDTFLSLGVLNEYTTRMALENIRKQTDALKHVESA